jgi:hypothetical protein
MIIISFNSSEQDVRAQYCVFEMHVATVKCPSCMVVAVVASGRCATAAGAGRRALFLLEALFLYDTHNT